MWQCAPPVSYHESIFFRFRNSTLACECHSALEREWISYSISILSTFFKTITQAHQNQKMANKDEDAGLEIEMPMPIIETQKAAYEEGTPNVNDDSGGDKTTSSEAEEEVD